MLIHILLISSYVDLQVLLFSNTTVAPNGAITQPIPVATVISQSFSETLYEDIPFQVDPEILSDCVVLSSAVYHSTPVAYLSENRPNRFTSYLAPNLDQNNGKFILTEVVSDSETLLYVAIRGSSVGGDWAASIQGWITDSGNGYVHSGWYGQSTHVPVNYLFERLKENRQGHQVRVILTGHSLGGAVAQLVTNNLLHRLNHHQQLKDLVLCVTFGTPLTMTGILADQMNLHHRSNILNFIHPKDAVPKLVTWCHSYLTTQLKSTTQASRGIETIISILEAAASSSLLIDTSSQAYLEIFRLCSSLIGIALPTVLDFMTYKPVGHYFLLDAETRTRPFFCPLNAEGIHACFNYGDFQLSPDLLVAHKMSGTYTPLLLKQLTTSLPLLPPIKETPSHHQIIIPDVIVSKVSLQLISGLHKVAVRISGTILHLVKTITFRDLPLCKINQRIQTNDCIGSHLISFECSINSNHQTSLFETETKSLSVTTTEVRLETFFNTISFFPNVYVSYENYHSLDACSLQELFIVSVYILIFSKYKEDTEPDTSLGLENLFIRTQLKQIAELIKDLLESIPATVLFEPKILPSFSFLLNDRMKSTILRSSKLHQLLKDSVKFLKEIELKMTQRHGDRDRDRSGDRDRPGERDRDKHGKRDRDRDRDRYGESHLLENKIEFLQLHNYFITEEWKNLCLISNQNGSYGNEDHNLSLGTLLGADSVMKLLRMITRKLPEMDMNLKEDISEENYSIFLQELATSLLCVKHLSDSIGRFYDPLQRELGPVGKVLDYLFYPLSYWPLFQTSLSLSLSSHEQSSEELCYYLLKLLHSESLIMMSSVGAIERSVAQELKLSRYALCSNSNLSMFLQFHIAATGKPSEQLSIDTSPRRSKLLIISSSLRETLKLLPIVVLSGLTTGGKSTLREMLHNPFNPNHNFFGLGDRQRTTIPQLIVCGESSQTYCVLDNLGLSDLTIPEETKIVLEIVNKIFDQIASAKIIIISHEDNRKNIISNQQAMFTSQSNTQSITLTCPVMTCFNKADILFDSLIHQIPKENRINLNELRENLLVKEAQDRVRKGRPFDLVSIAQNPFFPRVFSIFDPDKVNELEEINRKESIIITPKEVHEWLISIFYSKTPLY
jgi:hypothetical protein